MTTDDYYKPLHQYVGGGHSLEKRIDPPEEYDDEDLEEMEDEDSQAKEAAYESWKERDSN